MKLVNPSSQKQVQMNRFRKDEEVKQSNSKVDVKGKEEDMGPRISNQMVDSKQTRDLDDDN